jgi:hypothetical protein
MVQWGIRRYGFAVPFGCALDTALADVGGSSGFAPSLRKLSA